MHLIKMQTVLVIFTSRALELFVSEILFLQTVLNHKLYKTDGQSQHDATH